MAAAQSLILTLKNVLKSRAIPYSHIAKKLGLNETSIKRLMSGHTPMTLTRLDEICQVADLDFFELLKLARPSAPAEVNQLSLAQEQALADDTDLFLTFYGLVKGLGASDIVAKYKITEGRIQKALSQLDRLGLIFLLTENRVKFKVPRTVRWNERGPLALKYEREMQLDFISSDFAAATDFRKFLTFPMSERSKQLFARKLRELIAEMEAQSEIDVAFDKGIRTTSTVFIGLREWTPALLAKYRR